MIAAFMQYDREGKRRGYGKACYRGATGDGAAWEGWRLGGRAGMGGHAGMGTPGWAGTPGSGRAYSGYGVRRSGRRAGSEVGCAGASG